MDAKTFGTFISKIRKENHMTQAELAEKIRVTDKAVSRWERGLGFPDINTLEPLAEALGITLIELMKSEKSGKTDMCIDDASSVVAHTIQIAENQKRKERQQEKQIIIVTAGITALISVFILLIDQIGWSVENIVYTGTGVVLPMMSILTFFCFLIISLFRWFIGKSCKQTIIAALVSAGVLLVMFFCLFILALFGFPGQS